MNQICTSDIFKATYLLNKFNRLCAVKRNPNGEKQFIIKGHKLYLHDFRYRTGHASINPLVFKETYRFLQELEEKDQSLLEHTCLLLSEEHYESFEGDDTIVR